MSGMKPPTNAGNTGNMGNLGDAAKRSTRAQKPPEKASAGGTPGDGVEAAKSKLANGARNSNPGRKAMSTAAPTSGDAPLSQPSQPPTGGSQGRAAPNESQPKGAGDAGKGSDKQSRNQSPSQDNKQGAKGKQENAGNQSKPVPQQASDTNHRSDDSKGSNSSNGANGGQSDKQGGSAGEGGDNAKKDGILDKAKGYSANATGVDYSDKGLKDQLEHQAADVAMDATPGLGQVNSARKALKDYNKAKKAVGGKEGITDKAEEIMDDGVDKGIKGVKLLVGAKTAGEAGMGAMMLATMLKMLMMLKGMALAIIGKAAGFFAGIFSAVSSFVSGVLGATAAVGNAIAAGLIAIVMTGASMLGYGVVKEITNKDDSQIGAACVPSKTSVSKESQEYKAEGEADAIREENAKKLWSVYSALGGTKEKTAAVLGNLDHESGGLDPTAMETIYDEPFQIGPKKKFAIDSDYLIDIVAPNYGYSAITYMGIGLAQWTNGRNRLLVKYADDKGVKWYEFDTQMMFMLDGDDPMRQKQLKDFLTSSGSNVDEETDKFKRGWIGNNNNTLGVRQDAAHKYMFILERAQADTAYADSILSGLNVSRGEGNAAAGAYHQDDGCGDTVKSHYGNQAVDGTGEVPSDLTLVPWSRETLPESLKEFAKNPEDVGLAWGNGKGWANGIIPDQCAALSSSYFMQLYPDWNKGGRSTTRAFGDGGVLAGNWAKHYGESTTKAPSSGAMFSDTTTSVWGHTGIVQHVFANGDILIVEQNVPGVSGEANGMSYSWGWRVIKKERYEQANWTFFKPADAEPQWVKGK